MTMNMPVTTTFTIEGYRISQYLGVVRGIIVRAPTISQGIVGGLKSIIGGQIGAYTEMCETARQQAYELLENRLVTLELAPGPYRLRARVSDDLNVVLGDTFIDLTVGEGTITPGFPSTPATDAPAEEVGAPGGD